MFTTVTRVLAGVLLVAARVATADAPAQVEDARGCLSRPLPKKSSAQIVEIRTLEGDGVSTTLGARIVWKRLADGRHAALMRLLEPPEVANLSVLIRETRTGSLVGEGARGTEIFLYVPELNRVRRVSVNQATTSLFGTAFGYADFDRLQGQMRESRVETRGRVTLHGRRAYLVEASPPLPAESPYTKIVSHIDVETCLPLRAEFYDAKGERSKVLTADPARFERIRGIWVARSFRMQSLRDGVESELVVRSIEIDGDVSEDVFAPANLADEF
jgi:hypothetical protein